MRCRHPDEQTVCPTCWPRNPPKVKPMDHDANCPVLTEPGLFSARMLCRCRPNDGVSRGATMTVWYEREYRLKGETEWMSASQGVRYANPQSAKLGALWVTTLTILNVEEWRTVVVAQAREPLEER